MYGGSWIATRATAIIEVHAPPFFFVLRGSTIWEQQLKTSPKKTELT